MANSLFIVKAANAMLIRSRKQMTKRMKIKGRILIRTLWSVLASIEIARVADSLAKVHLSARLLRPEGLVARSLWRVDPASSPSGNRFRTVDSAVVRAMATLRQQ